MNSVPALSLLALSLAAVAAPPVEIEVTSSRSNQPLNQSLASVTVLTDVDIRQSQAQSLPDLLRGLAGITQSNSGGLGKAASLMVRGTNASHVLVLVDGLPINSSTLGQAPLEHIALNQIERIELVRGPRASLYGSDAIGGVLQIFTRKGTEGLRPSAKLGLATKGTFEAAAGLNAGNSAGWFNLNAEGLRTDGFNACNPNTGCWSNETDPDGYYRTNFGLNAGSQLNAATDLEFNLQQTRGLNEYDNSFGANRSRTEQQIAGVKLGLQALPAWKIRLSTGQTLDKAAEIDAHDGKENDYQSHIDGQRLHSSWLNELRLADNQQLNLGLDRTQDSVNSSNQYDQNWRQNTGVFGLYQLDVWQQQLQLSGRQDHSSQYGNNDTGAIAWGSQLTDSLRSRVSYGTAFKAPTLNDLYWPGSGNPTLQPEKSSTSEIGLDAQQGWGKWSVSLFRTKIDQLIAWAPDPASTSGNWRPFNVDKAEIRGLELQLDTEVFGWRSNNQLTLLDPKTKTEGANYDKRLLRRPTATAKLSLERMIQGQLLAVDWLAENHRFDNVANTKRTGGYGLLNLRTERALGQSWRWQFGLDNLLDHEYETAQGYEQAGLTAKFAIFYQPQ